MQRRSFLRLAPCLPVSAWVPWLAAHAQDTQESARSAVLAGAMQLFAAVQSSDAVSLRAGVAPQMVGWNQLRDDVAQLLATERQIRYHLREATVTYTDSAATVTARWERRFITASGPQPQIRSGTVSMAFTKIDNAWLLASFSGDNPFEPGVRR